MNIAIIGTGGIARKHRDGYLLFHEKCRIVAVCDVYREKAEEFALTIPNGKEVKVYEDYRDLIHNETIDGVSICTPPYTHAEVSIACLNAGIHVLCEKPMAPSVAECEAMNRAQRESGKILSICHQNRFRNDVQEVKCILDAGILGKTIFTRVDSFWWRTKLYYDLWWRGTWEKEGGGCVLNHAVHQLDLMLWFLGKPLSLRSFSANLAHDNSEVEDFNTTIIRFPDDSLAQFSTTLVWHGQEQKLTFQCEKGGITTPWDLFCSRPRRNGSFDGMDEDMLQNVLKLRAEYIPMEHERHDGAVSNFLNSISGEETVLCSGQDGQNVIELVTLIYQSFHEDREVDLEIDESNTWYTVEGILNNARHFYEKGESIANLPGEIST